MTDTISEDTGRVTRRDLAEGKIEKVLSPERTGLIPMNDVMGGLKFENAFQLAEAAKLMATAGPLLPPWLQGNVGGCWAVLLRSQETGISALALAQMMYVTEKKGIQRVGYDSVYFRTMVERFAPIKERLAARYQGEGDDLVCTVFATFKGEMQPREFPPKGTEKEFTLKKLHPGHNENGAVKGSPLWDDKPPLQMFYAMSRDWSRMYCADIVAGAYTREELVDAGYTEVVDVKRISDTSPKLRERLRGPVGEGFEHTKSSIEASIAAATPRKTGRTAAAASGATDGEASVEAASVSLESAPTTGGDDAAAHQSKEQTP